MKPLNCRATNKCQVDISEDPGYKELLSDIKKIIKRYESASGKTRCQHLALLLLLYRNFKGATEKHRKTQKILPRKHENTKRTILDFFRAFVVKSATKSLILFNYWQHSITFCNENSI